MTATQLIQALSQRIGVLGCDFEVKIGTFTNQDELLKQEIFLAPYDYLDKIYYYTLNIKQQ